MNNKYQGKVMEQHRGLDQRYHAALKQYRLKEIDDMICCAQEDWMNGPLEICSKQEYIAFLQLNPHFPPPLSVEASLELEAYELQQQQQQVLSMDEFDDLQTIQVTAK